MLTIRSMRPRLPSSLAFRRAVAIGLALLLPMQSATAAAIAATGPLHRHAADAAQVVLEDTRRVAAAAEATRGHRHLPGPSHAHADDRRHDHLGATGIGAVVHVADPWSAIADGDAETRLGLAHAAFVAVLPETVTVGTRGDRDRFAPSTATPVSSTDSRPLERPPRRR